MTREEKVNLLNELLEIEEKNDIGNLTSTDRREFQQWVEDLEQEPKTGYWISVNTGKQSHTKDGMTVESVKCSECDEWLTASDEYACNGNYCPNCGAKMQEV